jgi:hypothetical protein
MTPQARDRPSLQPRAWDGRLASFLVIAIALLAAAALLHFGVAPQVKSLPASYASETRLAVDDSLRQTPNGEWERTAASLRRVDQTIASTSETVIVQGDLHVYAESGAVIFESTGLYGVSRLSRQNMPGYGDTERTGQYLFPPDVQPETYTFWDPMFIGPRVATFDHAETQDGFPIYVFHFSATGLDETAGYSYLPDVPEKYAAHTDGEGTIWIEPVTGAVVDYVERGTSYFVEPATGRRIADFHIWTNLLSPETHAAQLALAAGARWRLLALTVWLPAGLGLASLAALGLGIRDSRRGQRRARGGADTAAPA